jgi:protocatechuate 3,4-dioxygenase beta subunit
MKPSDREVRRRLLKLGLVTAPLLAMPVWARVACVPAVTNILGPAYRKNAPYRTALCDPDEPGTPLSMTGTITDAATCKVLHGVLLDVWQVNARGDYDMDTQSFHLRGRMRTGADGRYRFESIEPVPYGKRPRHIHFLLTRDGYEPRITQCYFAGDERNATDPYVRKELIITPSEHAGARNGSRRLEGRFDIALERERQVDPKSVGKWTDYEGDYEVAPGVTVSIRRDGQRLLWHLSAAEEPGDPLDGVLHPRMRDSFFVAEYDKTFRFVRDEHGRVTHTLDDDGSLARKIR